MPRAALGDTSMRLRVAFGYPGTGDQAMTNRPDTQTRQIRMRTISLSFLGLTRRLGKPRSRREVSSCERRKNRPTEFLGVAPVRHAAATVRPIAIELTVR